MSKVVKKMMIDDIRTAVGEHRDLLVLDASKVDAVSANKWRLLMQSKKISVLGVRNSVAKAALREVGIDLADSLKGPSTIVWGAEDVVALAREIVDSLKDCKNLAVKGGTLSGTALSASDVEKLSKSPGRKEVLGQLVGLILSPGANLAGALLGAGGTLAGQVQSIAEKTE
ncbi:50S ribosomal protein L10 [Planctopirus hydrillae]|uniref:Large ribosomal subunit protein uL10 n=1 Tax=Planctopirus hydrillae TaxID=1841610 RepID=A0A1C3EAV9_9PLAN|nr:50S ribosomal protein L10 [Planctopirus hydrillae]ODA30376.1 50S ribosomal protein L10 [Planctopirus hydrillae]